MFWLHQLIFSLCAISVIAVENRALENGGEAQMEVPGGPAQPQRIQSSMLEVLMHLPPNFRDVRSFENFLQGKPARLVRRDPDGRSLVDVTSYEVAQPGSFVPERLKRGRREAVQSNPDDALVPQQLVSPLAEGDLKDKFSNVDAVPMPMADAIRGPMYTTYSVKEFDTVDIDDPDYPKRRKNESSDSREDNSQRDKRTFGGEGGSDFGDSTTSSPFWKRKKENPPFITGRGSSGKGNDYTPPQHRSSENARESHSLKNLEKSVQANEVNRPNQDNYYSSTNRRTYSRQSDLTPSSTPKSVYDIIDYSKKHNDNGRNRYFVKSLDERRGTYRDSGSTHEQFTSRQFMYNYPVHERSYYPQPPQYPSEIIGRGVEYYHRTYEPNTGRMIYYANMPENGRSLDYRYADSINRNFYVNRPYMYSYDPYYRNFAPPFESKYPPAMNRPMDYARMGRSNSQVYSYPYQERDRYQRDPRFNTAFDKGNRLQDDDVRNKTYIIFDADDNRSHFLKNQFLSDANRVEYNAPPPPPVAFPNYQGPQETFRQAPVNPPTYYYPQQSAYSGFRNQGYFGFNQGMQGDGRWQTNTNNVNYRPLNSPEVQLPLTTVNRNLPSREVVDSTKKA